MLFLPAAAADPVPDLRAAYSRPPAEWPAPQLDPGVAWVELGPLPARPPAARAEAALGARLFAEPALAADGATSCVACHDPAHGWADPRPAAPGRRQAPSLITAAWRDGAARGWDGRHATLAAQIAAPLADPREMATPGGLAGAASRLDAEPDWRARLGAARLTPERLTAFLAAYLAGLETPTRLDRFAAGDAAALDDREIRGLHLFRTRAGCANCHHGPLLSDGRFHNLGLSGYGEPGADLGRHAVTGQPEDAGRFRTPSLRHVARTAPYMHSGHFPTLASVVAFYVRGGGEVWIRNAGEGADMLRRHAATLSPHVRPLDLTPAERADLVAFLGAI